MVAGIVVDWYDWLAPLGTTEPVAWVVLAGKTGPVGWLVLDGTVAQGRPACKLGQGQEQALGLACYMMVLAVWVGRVGRTELACWQVQAGRTELAC